MNYKWTTEEIQLYKTQMNVTCKCKKIKFSSVFLEMILQGFNRHQNLNSELSVYYAWYGIDYRGFGNKDQTGTKECLDRLFCSTTGKPTRSFATERVSLDSV